MKDLRLQNFLLIAIFILLAVSELRQSTGRYQMWADSDVMALRLDTRSGLIEECEATLTDDHDFVCGRKAKGLYTE